jgi:membrane protease subunit HflK
LKRRIFYPLLLLILGYFATGIYQVSPGELAVVRRFGQALPSPEGPGLHIGLPWGCDRVDKVAVDEQRQLQVGFMDDQGPEDGVPAISAQPFSPPVGQALTGDNQMVNIRISISYRIDREHVLDYVLLRERAEDILSRAAEDTLASVLASEKVDLILLGRSAALESKLKEQLAERLRAYRLGLTLDAVNIAFAQPPIELVDIFREVNRARSQRDISLTEAHAKKNADISSARQEARRTLALGQVNANNRVAEARSEVAAFRALLKTFPTNEGAAASALLQIYLSEMQGILGRMQVRTLSDQGVEQTVVVPLPSK